MLKNIILAASLPAAPDKLFDMYLDAESHAAITGAPVIIEPRAGAPFRAFNGMLSGMILHVEPKRLIVQTWRSANWPATAIDSVLTLSFWPQVDGARIELVHVNVPRRSPLTLLVRWRAHSPLFDVSLIYIPGSITMSS